MENSCHLIQFKNNFDHRGQLTFMEGNNEIPFAIKRIYYLQNIPTGYLRGEHAHKKLEQVLIALSGQFEVIVDDGTTQQTYLLNHPQQGLYIGAMLWHELKNFSKEAVCLVLASQCYDESDYIRNYDQFLNLASVPQ